MEDRALATPSLVLDVGGAFISFGFILFWDLVGYVVSPRCLPLASVNKSSIWF